jgi:hypothetical protein
MGIYIRHGTWVWHKKIQVLEKARHKLIKENLSNHGLR